MSVRNESRFVGNMVADPEGRTVRGKDGETRVLNFTLAVNTWRDKEDVVYVDFEAWGKVADAIEEHCQKGDRLLVLGEYRVDSWDDKETGDKKYRSKFRLTECEMLKVKKWAEADAAGPRKAAASAKKAADPAKKSSRRRPEPEPEPEPEDEGDDDSIPF